MKETTQNSSAANWRNGVPGSIPDPQNSAYMGVSKFLIALKIFFSIIFFLCMGVLPTQKSAHYIHLWYHRWPEEDIRSPGIVVIVVSEPSCGVWEPTGAPFKVARKPFFKKSSCLTHF